MIIGSFKMLPTVCILFGYLTLVCGYEICSSNNLYYTYCDGNDYCCHGNTECCSPLSVGKILGIVGGVVFLISICVSCVVCCVRRRRQQPGTTINSPTAPSVSYVATSNSSGQQLSYGAPPPYNQATGTQGPYPVYTSPAAGRGFQTQYGFQSTGNATTPTAGGYLNQAANTDDKTQ